MYIRTSAEWQCQECGRWMHVPGSERSPATWPVLRWCRVDQRYTLHDRLVEVPTPGSRGLTVA
jgi:rRNA maturation protein Nop10